MAFLLTSGLSVICFSHELSFGFRTVLRPPLAVSVRVSWSALTPCLAVFVCASRSLVSKYPLPGLSSGVRAGVLGVLLLPAWEGDGFVRAGVDILLVAYVRSCCLCVSGAGPRW